MMHILIQLMNVVIVTHLTLTTKRSLTKLNMRGIGASRDGIIQLSESLALNKAISLVSIDLSNNPIEDRGMVLLIPLLINVANLN
jgi:hypothetical protein